jgi:hypothetical protein
MEKTKHEQQSDKYPSFGKTFRLVLGIFDLALCFYMFGFCIYRLIVGNLAELPQISAVIVATLPSGVMLIRSSREDNLKRASRDLLQ